MSASRRTQMLLASCAMGLAWSAQTGAQTVDASKPGTKQAARSEEIVVTAQRRKQRLVDVPASVTAVSGRQLERSGVRTVLELGEVAVGTQVQRQGGFVQPAIRGVSTLTTGIGFENNVALYIDGFYQPDSVSLASGFAAIGDIEVLKGPQGTLYGRNATGGAVLIETPEPSTKYTGNFQASYARFNDHVVQGYLSGPIGNGDLATFSISAYNRHSDGYIHYVLGEKGDASPFDSTNVRTKVKITPSSDVTVTLGYNHTYLDDPFGLVFTYNEFSPIPATLRATAQNTATNNVRSINPVTVDSFTDKTVVNTDYGTLTSRTGYDIRKTREHYDFDGTLVPIFDVITDHNDQNTFQQALDFQAKTFDHLDLLFGAFYYNDHTSIIDSTGYSFNEPLASSTSRLGSSAGAAYANGTYHFGKFALSAGIRGNIERRSLSYYQIASATVPAVQPGRAGKTFEGATPSATLSYALSHRTSLYASFSTGYRSGVFEPAPVPSPADIKPIKPERITAYEIGAKTSQSFWTLNTAAFYYEFRDMQVGVVEPDPVNPGGGVIEAVLNAYKATTYGAEIEGTVRPTDNWSINGGLSLLHARYDNFRDAIGTGLNLTNPAVPVNATSQPQDWSGQELSRSPTVTANLGSNYIVPLAGGEMTLSGNASFSSSYVPNDPSLYGPLAGAVLAGKQRFRVGAYAVLNADISWTDASGHYTVSLFGTNITNSNYISTITGSAFGDSRLFGEPASYGLRLGYKF